MVTKTLNSDTELIAYTVEHYGEYKVINGDLRTLMFAVSREQLPEKSYKLFSNGTDMSILYK